MKRNSDNDNDEGIKKIYREVAPYLELGLQLAVTVTVMVFIGLWLDGEFESSPYLTITFAFLGIFAGMYNFLKTVLKSDR